MNAQRNTQADHAAKVEDLVQWSKETGNPLPMPAETIADLEQQGAVVDLETGAVHWPQLRKMAVQ